MMVSGWQRPPPDSGMWPLKSICHNTFGAAFSKRFMRRGAAARRNDAAMPAQDVMHRRADRRAEPAALQAAHDLACAPGRMGVTHRQHLLLGRSLGALRARVRTARAIGQLFPRGCAAEPRVPRVRMNPKPPAQFAPVGTFLHRKPHELSPLVHLRHLFPRHGWPPFRKPNPCKNVSVMSPDNRRGCLRAIHLTRRSRLPNQCLVI